MSGENPEYGVADTDDGTERGASTASAGEPAPDEFTNDERSEVDR